MKQIVNNRIKVLIFCIVFVFVNSCKKDTVTNIELELLKTYVQDNLYTNKLQTLTIGKDNSNNEIFKVYNRHLNKEKKDFDSVKKIILNKIEFENYNSQTLNNSFWSDDFEDINGVTLANENDKDENILYITKPIYTINKDFAMLYSYKKHGEKKVIVFPRIEVYKNKKGKWEKIGELNHF